MGNVQILPGDFNLAEDWPYVRLWRHGKVFTSDSFTQAGKLLGSLTDTYRGGQPIRWEGYDSWDKSAGKTTPRSTGPVGLAIPGADYEAEIYIDKLQEAGELRLGLRRNSLEAGGDVTELTVRIFSTGTITLVDTSPGSSVQITSSTAALKDGDRLSIEIIGQTARVMIDGNEIIVAQIEATEPGYFSLNTNSANTTSSIFEVVITAL